QHLKNRIAFPITAIHREVLDAVDRVTNSPIERRIEGRRAGDPAELVSDPARIRSELPWDPRFNDLDTIVSHALAWERKLSQMRELNVDEAAS
ncbi:MAG: hypothetical protein AAFW59_11480, partial [Pseudomonadota bacterium]